METQANAGSAGAPAFSESEAASIENLPQRAERQLESEEPPGELGLERSRQPQCRQRRAGRGESSGCVKGFEPPAEHAADFGGRFLNFEDRAGGAEFAFKKEPELERENFQMAARLEEVRRFQGLGGVLRHDELFHAGEDALFDALAERVALALGEMFDEFGHGLVHVVCAVNDG